VSKVVQECLIQCHAELSEELGRPPTTGELVELTGISWPTVTANAAKLRLEVSDGRKLRGGSKAPEAGGVS
jgi:hypothetical protein